MSLYSETTLLTQKLVQIPTENPNGTEEKCAEFIEDWLKNLDGVNVTTQKVEEGRVNIIAHYGAATSSHFAPLVILAHMDTVPAEEGWEHPPFQGEIIDGKLYGRGACDMKSGLACALMTIKEVSTHKLALKRDLYVIATIDEEGPYMKGAIALVEEGLIPDQALLIATEPTNLTLSTVHKGTIWYEVVVNGKSAHGGNAHLGADAAHAAAEMIVHLKKRVNELPYEHPIFGKPSLSVGTIAGGHKTNMVAGSCRIELDFRLVPPMTNDEADRLVEEAAEKSSANVDGTSVQINHYGWARPPLETKTNSVLSALLKEAFLEVEGTELVETGFPAYTDVSMIGLKTGNRDLVVFGPGHLNEAHAIDEFVSVDQIDRCTEVLIKVAQK